MDCFSVIWTIQNFSYCWQNRGQALSSPGFHALNKNSKWHLFLFPYGRSDVSFITVCLCKKNETDLVTDINYSIQFLASDGSEWNIKNDSDHKCTVKRAEITEAIKYLPDDILTLRLTISSFGKGLRNQQLVARTIINVEKIFLQTYVEKFSNWEFHQANSFRFKSAAKDILMPIEPIVKSNDETVIQVNLSALKSCTKSFALKAFILDDKKTKVDAGEFKSWEDKEKSFKFILTLSEGYIMRNKSLYLPNDVLTLCFELTISSGHAFNFIDNSCDNTVLPTDNIVSKNCLECVASETISVCPCPLITDLTALQKDHSTCDMKLRAKTGIFPVHTLILSTRSPVFKAMFASEMKETLNGCVDVSDLDDDVVHRFLLYLYTNQLEDMEWEDAYQLYAVADKYAVISLKDKCSAFLKNNLLFENVCNVLTLADMHQDTDLKVTAQNFILKNASSILKSEDWKILVDSYSKLAIETLSRNWIKD